MRRRILLVFMLIMIMCFAESTEKFEKGKIIEEISRNKVEDENVSELILFSIEIKSGEYKGEIVEIEHPVFINTEYNIDIKKGDHVLLSIEQEEGNTSMVIIDIDKTGKTFQLLLLFFIAVIILGKFKGVKAILALSATVLLVFWMFVPLILRGWPPVLSAVILSVIATFITILLISGISRKSIAAVIGTTGGVILAGIISTFFIKYMKLTGFPDIDAIYAAEILNGIDVKELVSAGIIIGSLGAVMDVAISISSSLEEVLSNSKEITHKGLFGSGMKIGSDIIGTMVNTLVLAYVGSSLLTVLILAMQRTDYPLIRILNFEFIVTEVLRSIAGSIGIIVSVPLTAFVASRIYEKR